MIKNNKILQVGVWYSLLIFILSWIWIFPSENTFGPIFGILYLVLTVILYFWVFKTIDQNAFLINLAFTLTFTVLVLLFKSYMPFGFFIALPSFIFLFGFILACWIQVYLVPKFPTAYNAILISHFKEISIIGGLIAAFVGWVMMGEAFSESDVSLLDQLDSLLGGFHAATLSILYGLCLSLVVFDSSRINNNIIPDQSCFMKVKVEKKINYRSLFAFPVLFTTSIGSIAFAFYVEGAYGNFGDFFELGSIPMIIFILLATIVKSGNQNYLSSLKILFYDKHGEYDIMRTSSTIRTIKQFVIYATILLLIMLFIGSLSLTLTKTFQLVSAISAILFTLYIVYFIIMMQDIEILQNAILRGKFDEYKYSENASGIYRVCAIYIGVLSFIVLLNLIKT